MSEHSDADYRFAACGLLVTASDGTIERVNDTFCGWTGHHCDDLFGRRFQDLLTMGSKLFHQTHWFPLLELQGSVAELQLELVHREKGVLAILVNAAKRASDGRIDIAVFIATDRKRYERELLAARKRAEELLASEHEAQALRKRAEDALVAGLRQQEREADQRAQLAEQLIGIVSHDLRNPLNAVLLGTRLLSATDLGAHNRTAVRIASAAERATRLVDDLLDFTQARIGGGIRVRPMAIDLHALVADCLEEVKLAWPGRMVAHERIGEGPARGDGDRLAQVVTNLANNALTYGTPEAPITFTSVVAPAGLEIRAHNSGRPIAPDIQARIFEPLHRGDEHVKLGSRSVGLGLYIVRAIATAHGGTVSLRSTTDEGTTFVFAFPGV